MGENFEHLMKQKSISQSIRKTIQQILPSSKTGTSLESHLNCRGMRNQQLFFHLQNALQIARYSQICGSILHKLRSSLPICLDSMTRKKISHFFVPRGNASALSGNQIVKIPAIYHPVFNEYYLTFFFSLATDEKRRKYCVI